MPASTGKFERIVHIFSSNVQNNKNGCCSKLFNTQGSNIGSSRAADTPQVISSGEGREISKVNTVGWLKICFQVNFRDINLFGLSSH